MSICSAVGGARFPRCDEQDCPGSSSCKPDNPNPVGYTECNCKCGAGVAACRGDFDCAADEECDDGCCKQICDGNPDLQCENNSECDFPDICLDNCCKTAECETSPCHTQHFCQNLYATIHADCVDGCCIETDGKGLGDPGTDISGPPKIQN